MYTALCMRIHVMYKRQDLRQRRLNNSEVGGGSRVIMVLRVRAMVPNHIPACRSEFWWKMTLCCPLPQWKTRLKSKVFSSERLSNGPHLFPYLNPCQLNMPLPPLVEHFTFFPVAVKADLKYLHHFKSYDQHKIDSEIMVISLYFLLVLAQI